MIRDDHDLLTLFGSVGIRVGEIATGLFDDSLSCDDQLAVAGQLGELAEGFHQWVSRTPFFFDVEAT